MEENVRRCPIDEGRMAPLFSARIMDKYDVRYDVCETCSLIQTETPYWLDEAYGRALAVCDTGVMERNLHNAVRAAAAIWLLAGKEAKVVDVAGGYGILVRLLRDIGFDCVWEDKYCENILAPGFERPAGFVADVACAFEVFEHVADPRAFFEEIVAQHGGRFLLFSTESFTKVPDRNWAYFAFGTGQHIVFYSRESLARLARRAGWRYHALPRHLHLFAKEPVAWWKLMWLGTPLLYLVGLMVLVLMRRRSRTQSDSRVFS